MKISDLNEKQRRRFYFEKYYPDLLKEIDLFNLNMRIENFSMLLYHFVNRNFQYPNKCKTCENSTKFISFNKGYNTYCSKKCVMSDAEVVSDRNMKSKETSLKKWGVDNPMKSEAVKKTQQNSIMIKWGVDNYTKTEEYKKNEEKRNLEKYGKKFYLQTDDFKKKSEESNLSKRGLSHHMKDKEVVEKYKDNSLKKWGVDNYTKTEDFKERMKSYFKSESFFENLEIQDKKREEKELQFYENYIENELLSIGNGLLTYKCFDCDNSFTISKQLLYLRNKKERLICTNCNPKIGNNISVTEKELLNFIRDNYQGEIIENYKDKYEIDVFLPEINLGFEYNGLWFHSVNFKNKFYHQEKYLHFRNKNISVVNIWEDDWANKKDIVESMIRYKIGSVSAKISARKCDVKIIKNTKDFLNKNHLQGFCPSTINIGLFYNDEMVSLLTIGKSRNKKNEMEILRFCNKLNLSVVGGFSKLLTFFLRNYEVQKIVTYSDLSHSDGALYLKNGFDFVGKTEPGYYWCKNGYKYNRFKFRKSVLIKNGFDKTKTEVQIMNEQGFYKLYNCGNYKFELMK
jgi:hypothetical protein